MERRVLRVAGGRGFVGSALAGAPAPMTPAASGDDELERYVQESGHYRLLQDVGRVDWIVVSPEGAPTPGFRLELIDLDAYPEDGTTVRVPFGDRAAEFSVLGPVPYTVTASWRHDEQRLVQHIWFAVPVW